MSAKMLKLLDKCVETTKRRHKAQFLYIEIQFETMDVIGKESGE